MKRYLQITGVLALIGTFLIGCASDPYTRRGAAGGSLAGAGLGAIAGNNIKGMSRTEGAVAGALVGGLLGGGMGRQQGQIAGQQQQIAAMQQQMNTRTVNVTNSNGSVTPVVLRQTGNNQWQGPRGEIYNSVPSPSQLKAQYGF